MNSTQCISGNGIVISDDGGKSVMVSMVMVSMVMVGIVLFYLFSLASGGTYCY